MNILIANISDILQHIDNSILSTKFGSQKKNIEYTTGRLLVNFGAKKFFNLENFEIDETDKKPVIKGNLFEFSISHSNDIVAVGFSKDKIGIDIEKIVPRNYQKLASRMGFNCSNLEEFYKQWTQYEAEFKSGIKRVKTFPYESYMLSVSAENLEEINFYKIDLKNSIYRNLKI